MNPPDNKPPPREFWVKDFKQARTVTMAYLYDAFDKPPQLNSPTPHIHVIEKSAYDTLQKAYNDLKDRFKQEMINRGAEESYHENIQQVELIFKGDD